MARNVASSKPAWPGQANSRFPLPALNGRYAQAVAGIGVHGISGAVYGEAGGAECWRHGQSQATNQDQMNGS